MRSKETSHILDVLDEERRILKRTSYWPKREPTWRYKCRGYFMWMLDIAFALQLCAEVTKNLINGEYKEFTEVVSFLTSLISYNLKHLILDLKSKLFVDLLDKLDDPMLHDFPRACDDYVAKQNRFTFRMTRGFQFMAGGMVLTSALKPFLSGETAMQFTVFELGAWFYPFHCFQVAGMLSGCYNNATFDCLCMALMSVCSTQFKILKQKLMNCRKWAGITTEEVDEGVSNGEAEFDPQFDLTLNKYLNGCVQHHLKILDIVDDVDSVFCYLLLCQCMTSVLAICNTWFQFMWEDTMIKKCFLGCYGTALFMQLFLYCVSGDQVMTNSQEIRDACYFADWYKSNNSIRKSFMLIMERAKRPNLMTAGKIAIVNLPQYTSLMRTTYSYFALMNRMYGK